MTSADRPSAGRTGRAPATALFLFAAGLTALGGAGCGGRSPESGDAEASQSGLATLAGEALGTSWVVKWRADETPVATSGEALRLRIEGELERVDAAMSTWRDDSELTRWNRARTTEPLPVSPELEEVVAQALAIAARTGGAFDPTVGPLVDAWGFGAGSPGLAAGTPPPARLEELRTGVGWEKLTLDRAAGTLAKGHLGLELDLSGIAKGWAVDRISESLLDAGIADHLVEVGGEVVARGVKEPGQPWTVGIERPVEGMRAVQKALPLEDRGLATSGDYRNYREVDGERVSHLLDPRTGRPIAHRLASVSVVAETCTEADALATGLIVLGAEKGVELAISEGITALFLVREGDGFREITTGALDPEAPDPQSPPREGDTP